MKIGIDARAILNPEKAAPTGVANYVYNLVKNLLEIDKDNQYVLFFDYKVRDKDVEKFSQSNVKIKFFPFSDYKKYMPGAYSEILGMATYVSERLDVLHSTSPLYRVPAAYKGRVITTLYDFAQYRVADLFPRLSVAKTKALYSFMASKSDRIIAVSQSTKKDIREFLNYPLDRIDVIYNGIDSRFFDECHYSEDLLKENYGIKDEYILFLGTLEPRKNLVRVIEAFARFKTQWRKTYGQFNYQLVIAGKKGWLAEEYQQIAKDFEIMQDTIFTGYVAGDELQPLYTYSQFFVMPSLYEGFGQTIVEAMACGTPSIVSRVSSIPEIADNAVYYVDPHDTEGISQAMYDLAKNSDLRKSLSEKGKCNARQFDWEKCALETLGVYRKMLK